ncbi:MAG: outer membrane beta-barrel protein [Parvularculaceae bacterium]|nr:outer membrane beta-barrel protein [Parvularculaceae bacterium]
MKTAMMAAAAALGLSTSASAADWSGFYVGANVGYLWGSDPSSVTLGGSWSLESAALRSGVSGLWGTTLKPKGIAYGAQGGFNKQFAGGWVLGGELDYAHSGADDARLLPLTATTAGPTPTYGPGNSIKVKDSVSAKLKLGFSTGSTLFYATGGWSMANAEGSAEITSSGSYSKRGTDSSWLSGWVYGAGVEHKFAPNWSARIEYLRGSYADFEYATAYRPGSTFAPPAFNYSEIIKQDLTTNSVRLGVNLHF